MHKDAMAPARHACRENETPLINDKNRRMARHDNASGNCPNHTALEKNQQLHVVCETKPPAGCD
ncbi:MAG: hypothetical protein QF358_10185 [Arenicellales bacterium]|jgi:hypothetical protein|nr:hypothetical protein [Arenicellales bacterium]